MSDNVDDLALEITRDTEGSAVRAIGEIDSSNCTRVQVALTGLVTACCDVELDLAEVTFIDSSGLRALLVGQRAIEAGGHSLRVSAASDRVRHLFDLTGLEDQFGLAGRGLT